MLNDYTAGLDCDLLGMDSPNRPSGRPTERMAILQSSAPRLLRSMVVMAVTLVLIRLRAHNTLCQLWLVTLKLSVVKGSPVRPSDHLIEPVHVQLPRER